jgi:hypothetical protein
MLLVDDQLEHITRMAAAAYSPVQIAFAMGLDKEAFKAEISNPDSPANIAFWKGFYSSELAIRESAFNLARNGSSPAQTLALKQFDEILKTMKKDGTADNEL